MKRKTNKKSGIIAAVVGLSAVSLVSIGFASWVMSGGDETTVDGTISVETVDDKRFLIAKSGTHAPKVDYGANVKGQSGEGYEYICFGIDDTDNTGLTKIWLTAGGTGDKAPKYENLSADIIFYVANLKTTDTGVPSAVLSVTGNTSGWNAAVTATYVAAAPTNLTCTIASSGEDQTFTDDDTGLVYRKVTAHVQFAWGAYFKVNGVGDPVNPYVFFNKQSDTITNTTTAKTVLDALETDLTNVTFQVALKTTVPAANSGN